MSPYESSIDESETNESETMLWYRDKRKGERSCTHNKSCGRGYGSPRKK